MNINAAGRVNRKGIVLIVSLVTIVLLTTLEAAVMSRARNELHLAERNMLTTRALYLAEAGIEQAAYDLGNYIVVNFVDPSFVLTDTIDIDQDFTVDYNCNAYSGDADDITRLFRITSTAAHTGGVTVSLDQIVSRNRLYTFQHAVFYADDLELLPGPNMTFSGAIHSNKDIYVDCNNTLTIDSEYFMSAGNIYNKRKDREDRSGGSVSIKVKGTEDYELMDPNGASPPYYDSDHPEWTDLALSRWGDGMEGTVQSSVHGVTSLAVPVVGSIQSDGYYAGQAAIVIENNTIYKRTATGLVDITGDVPPGTVTVSETFYNNREEKAVRMTDISLDKLGGGEFGEETYANNLPANGLIYVTRTDAAEDDQPGVRLIEGQEIKRADGLTVVSNDPVYIQGDYNSVDKKPCAVVCDAINILSNNWDDLNSTDTLGSRVPSDTTINTAFIAGVDVTETDHYNGGVENYPRMHEHWSKSPRRELMIRGSFISLWEPGVAEGEWKYGSSSKTGWQGQYTAPIRNWDWDTDFANDLPPFTPFAVKTERKIWW